MQTIIPIIGRWNTCATGYQTIFACEKVVFKLGERKGAVAETCLFKNSYDLLRSLEYTTVAHNFWMCLLK